MKIMEEIKKMTGQELADYMTSDYVGVEDGLYFTMNIDGCEIGYTLALDNEGIVESLIRQGKLSEKDIDEIVEEKCEDFYQKELKEENYFRELADGDEDLVKGFGLARQADSWQVEEFRKEAMSELAEMYLKCEEEVDREVIEYFRDSIIDEIEEELQELKDKDEDNEEW